MKYFKLKQGLENSTYLTAENYEMKLKELPREEQKKYSENKEDNSGKRYFAICPACDNPTQIIGLYSKSDNNNLPYAKHYNRDTKIAKHDERAYTYCPFASHSYSVNKSSRRENFTDFEKKIYLLARDNFDIAVYIAKRETGICFSKNKIRELARSYYESEAFMYYHATSYNVPWMFLYFSEPISCYGLVVQKGSIVYEYLKTREGKDVRFEEVDDNKVKVLNVPGKRLDLIISFLHHKIREEKEALKMGFALPNEWQKFVELEIDPTAFLGIANHRKYPANEEIISIGKKEMPIFWEEE